MPPRFQVHLDTCGIGKLRTVALGSNGKVDAHGLRKAGQNSGISALASMYVTFACAPNARAQFGTKSQSKNVLTCASKPFILPLSVLVGPVISKVAPFGSSLG